jgi:K+-dependent Na+/Ca+ exchanger-like protein
MEIFTDVTALIAIFIALKFISDEIEISATALAGKLKIPATVAGATLLAIASSAPEFFTATNSALFFGVFEIGLQTIIWSAIFNVLIIFGASALVAKKDLKLPRRGISRDLIFYFVTILFLSFAIFDGEISRTEAIGLVAFFAFYIVVLFFGKKEFDENEKLEKVTQSREKIFFTFFGGISAIGFLCHSMIEHGLVLAENLKLPIAIISALIFSIGTSIPDLLVSVAAAKKGNGASAIANIFGSNTFDICIGLGIPILIVGKTPIEKSGIVGSIVLLFASVILVAAMILQNFKT